MDCTKCHLPKELAKGKRWCKDCKNEYERQRRAKDREKHNEKSREKYQQKKEQVLQQEIKIDETQSKICSVCNETKTLDNFYIAKCKGNIRAMCKTCSTEKRKEYYQNNKEEVIKQTMEYQNKKKKTDPDFKIEKYLRTRIYTAFTSRGLKKSNRTWKYIGCTSDFFRKWIEFQLYDGMTLENYGEFWHIDHVKPCSSFDLSKEEDIEKCFSWRNMRPLRSDKNKKKNDKIIPFDILLQELKVNVYLKGINKNESKSNQSIIKGSVIDVNS
jgi:hypothetical protein